MRLKHLYNIFANCGTQRNSTLRKGKTEVSSCSESQQSSSVHSPRNDEQDEIEVVWNKSVFVACKNQTAKEMVEQLLSATPFNTPVVKNVSEASNVILIIDEPTFNENSDINQALDKCRAKHAKLMVLYIQQEDLGIDQLIKRFRRFPKLSFTCDEEWTPWYLEDERGEYREAALLIILRSQELLDCSYKSHFHFFLPHMQKTSQAVVAKLHSKLCNELGFRVWWDMEATNLSTRGMKHGVENCDNFILVLNSRTLSSWFVRLELQTAIENNKNIVVMYDEDEKRGSASKTKLKQALEKYKFDCASNLPDDKWISINLRSEFSNVMIMQLLSACGIAAPNQHLHDAFKNIEYICGTTKFGVTRPGIEIEMKNRAASFQVGTREWILQKVNEWSNDYSAHKVLAIVGHAGIGKSVVAARIIELGLKQTHEGTCVVAFHHFVHDDPEYSNPRNCILSLCKQLRDNVNGFRNACDGVLGATDVGALTDEDLFTRLVVNPAKHLNATKRVVVVIDALDECKDGTKFNQSIVSKWKENMPSWLGLLVTCRPSVIDFPNTVEKGNEVGISILSTNDGRNREDVKIVIRDILSKHFDQGMQLNQAVDTLTTKSEGLFLYVRFLQDELKKNPRNQISVKDIQQFPSGIEGVYRNYFERLHTSLGHDTYQDVVGAILSSRGPLPKELWMRCFGIQNNFDDRTRSNGEFKKFRDAQKVLKSLMHIPLNIGTIESPGVCFFIHKSMSDFLLKGGDDEKSALKLGLDHLHISTKENGSSKLLEQLQKLWKTMCISTTKSVAKDYVIRNMFYHLCLVDKFEEASKMIFDLDALLLWLSRSKPVHVASDIESYLVKNIGIEDEHLVADAKVVVRILQFGKIALSIDYSKLQVPNKQIPSELPSQILARLPAQGLSERLKTLRSEADRYSPGVPWIKPLSDTLETALPTQLANILIGHEQIVTSVAYNDNGTRIASGSLDSTIRIWDASAGEPMNEPFYGHRGPVHSVAFNKDGSRLVSGSDDTTVLIWDVATGKQVGSPLAGHNDVVTSVAFNHDGTRVVSGSNDATVRIWDVASGVQVGSALQGHSDGVTAVALNHNGSRVVSGSEDGTVRVWDVASGEQVGKPLKGHCDGVTSVAINHDDSCVASGSADATICVWDISLEDSPPKLIGCLQGHEERVSSVAFNHDGTQVVSGSWDRTVRIWDLSTNKQAGNSFRGHGFWVTSVAFNPDGTGVVSGSHDKTVRMWDCTFNNEATESQVGHRDIVKSVSFDPTATRLVSGSWDGTIILWDAVTGKTVSKPLTGHESGVRSVVFNHDGTRILSGSTDKTIRAWDTKTQTQVGAPFKTHQEHIYCVQYNRDDSLILSTSNDNTIRVWESTMMDNNTMIGATHQHQLFSGHLDCVYAAAFNHDSSLIASGSRDNTVRIWDTKTRNLAMEPLRGHTSCVRFVKFSKDGSRVVSGSEDGIVKVWDVKTGKSVDDIQSAEHAKCYNSLPLEGRGTHARIPFLGDMIGFTTSSPITIGICAAVFDTQHNVWRVAIGDGFRVHLLYLCDGLC